MHGLIQQKSSALLSPRLKTNRFATVLCAYDVSRVESVVGYRPCGERVLDEFRRGLC